MEAPTEPLTKSYPTTAQSFGIAGIIIGMMLLFIPIHFFLAKVVDEELSMLVYYLASTGISFYIVYHMRRRSTGASGIPFTVGNPRIMLPILATTLALIIGVILPLSSLIPLPEFVKELIQAMSDQKSAYTFGLLVIAAPVLEELIFRGIMLDGLLKNYSPAKAILLSSFLFGLVHLNPWQFITAFVIGAFSGWVYYRTKNLMPCIFIHAATNLTSFSVRYFMDVNDVNTMLNGSLADQYGGLNVFAVLAGCGLTIGVCLYILQREFDRTAVSEG